MMCGHQQEATACMLQPATLNGWGLTILPLPQHLELACDLLKVLLGVIHQLDGALRDFSSCYVWYSPAQERQTAHPWGFSSS